LDANNIDAYLCLGGVLETLKQIPLAEKQYRYALEKDPENGRAKESLVRI
jgi:Tfp pilus assembly protein PilF